AYHPYYLRPTENSKDVLVLVLLSESNYQSWAGSMRLAISLKKKLMFVDGSAPAPVIMDLLFMSWQQANRMVLGWIFSALEPTVAGSMMGLRLDSAFEVWQYLQDQFGKPNLIHISQLQDQIYALRQGELSVADYFKRFSALWDELVASRPMPSCICSQRCSCNVIPRIHRSLEVDRIMQFLRGLEVSFADTRSRILLMDPLPSISDVFFLIVQQEREFAAVKPSDRHSESLDMITLPPTTSNVCIIYIKILDFVLFFVIF
ncbi:hypothetical protein LINPERPRIM_LOCUS8245, partial [Linum perenne]